MEPITTGSLIRRSLQIFKAGFTSFSALILVFYSPIMILKMIAPELAALNGIPQTGPALMLFFGTLLLTPIASAAVVFGVFQGLRGQPATLSQCVAVAAKRWMSIIGLALLTGVAVFLGFMLCILPGIVLTYGLFLAGPVLIVESVGPAAAAQRSWDLTEGYKLIIFFLGLFVFLLQVAFGLLMNAAFGFTVNVETLTTGSYGLFNLLNDLSVILAAAFNAVAAAVAYHDIRVFREGLGEDDLVAVFE